MSAGSAQVLALLREAGGGAVSGEALSSAFGVSRAQIWKHVETLRRRGYGIEGEPGGGYRLSTLPDRLYPEEIATGLTTRWLGRELVHHEEIDSTNRAAFEWAREGAPHGAAVLAEAQTAGRGRLGRRFFSPPHRNLYVSIVLRPSLTVAEAPTLIPVAGVAVAEAVAAVVGDDASVEIKWPNDVLLGGRKTSGILMEMSAEAARVGFAILGIGVNLNVDPASFPAEFREHATSLRAHLGADVDRAAFARRLFGILEEALDAHARDGFAALRSRFDARFRMAGREIEVTDLDGARTTGVARGVAADGALELERPDGAIVRVLAGDVTLSRRGRLRQAPGATPGP